MAQEKRFSGESFRVNIFLIFPLMLDIVIHLLQLRTICWSNCNLADRLSDDALDINGNN